MDVSIVTQSSPLDGLALFDLLQAFANLIVAITAIGALWISISTSKAQRDHEQAFMDHEKLKLMPRLVQTTIQDEEGQKIGVKNVGVGPAEVISIDLYKRIQRGEHRQIPVDSLETLSLAMLKELRNDVAEWEKEHPDEPKADLFTERQYKQSLFGVGVIIAPGENLLVLHLQMPGAVHPALQNALGKFSLIPRYRSLLGEDFETPRHGYLG